MASISINLTNECNLDCSYCFQKQANKGVERSNFKTPIRMTKEVASEVIKKIKKEFRKSKLYSDFLSDYVKTGSVQTIHISFTGGEPTLNLDVMEFFIVELNKIKDKYIFPIDFYFFMPTNCKNIDSLNDLGKKLDVSFEILPSLNVGMDIARIKELSNIKVYLNRVMIDSKTAEHTVEKEIKILKSFVGSDEELEVRVVLDYAIENSTNFDFMSFKENILKVSNILTSIDPENKIKFHSAYFDSKIENTAFANDIAIDTDGLPRTCHRLFGTAPISLTYNIFDFDNQIYSLCAGDICHYRNALNKGIKIPKQIDTMLKDSTIEIKQKCGGEGPSGGSCRRCN